MSLILHNIEGRFYWYDHYRVHGRKTVKTDYVGCEGSGNGHKTVRNLKDAGFRNKPGYKARHEYANQKEKEKYGEERFNELQNHIQERIPKGELAGKYDECNTYINERIDPQYHEEIRYHEEQERDYERKYQRSEDKL